MMDNPSRLLHTPVAHLLYDVLTSMPADLINIVTTYKQFEDADRSIDDGEWFEDGTRRGGFGTQIWKNGDWQQGLWISDQLYNGRGRMTRYDNKIEEGVWFSGVFWGGFEGKWSIDEPYAKGTLRETFGAVYVGELHYGDFEGQGKFVYPFGESYEGGWCEHRHHGHGVLSEKNGDRNVGEFVHGKVHVRKAHTLMRMEGWTKASIVKTGSCRASDGMRMGTHMRVGLHESV